MEAEKAEQQEETKKVTDTEEKKADTKDADYWRQQAQQNDANTRRERQTRETNEKEAENIKAQLSETAQELQESKEKFEQQSKYQKMDKDIVDPAVASNIEALQKRIEGLSDSLNKQEAKITLYEQNETQREQDRQYDKAIDSICKPLDEQYGQKYRSEARALADKAVDDGVDKKPQTTLESYLLHEKFYKQLSEKKDVKKTSATDTGKGTIPIKGRKDQGKFSEVLDDMKKTFKLGAKE